MLLRKTYRFEASHLLPKHPGKCSRLHGHSWVLHVETEGQIKEETGFVMDYAEMSVAVKPLIEKLDHRHLGAWAVFAGDRNPEADKSLLAEIWGDPNTYVETWRVPGLPMDFYPTSENLLYWIGTQLAEVKFPWSKVALEETCTSYAELKLDEFMTWYANKFGLEATAQALLGWK